jgi:hypothetical protein
MATTGDRTAGATSDQRRWPRRVAQVSAAMLIAGAAINAILAAAAPQAYADLGTWTAGPEPLQQLWAATMGEHPRVWVPIIGVGYEAAAGLLALSGDRNRALAGLVGIAAFAVGLLVKGLWLWALPWLIILVPAIAGTVRSPRLQI